VKQRDEKRWEVDPASAEDYVERLCELRSGKKKSRSGKRKLG